MIDEGRWTLTTRDHEVHVTIRPRRAVAGEKTRLYLRAEPMPLLDLSPEDFGGEPVEAWVWDGTPEAARSIVERCLGALSQRLRPEEARSKTAMNWRMRVLESLKLLESPSERTNEARLG